MVVQTNLKVAAIQMVSEPDWSVNIQTAARLVKEAALNGARLIVLPEFFIQITTPDDSSRFNLAENFGRGPIQKRLSQISSEFGVYLLAGTQVLKPETDNDKFFNSSIVYAPNGSVHCRYDKMHLFKFDDGNYIYDEGKHFISGEKITTCSIDGFSLGLSTCYDLRFPELYRQMNEPDIIVLPSAFTYVTGEAHWEILCRARAIENQCYFIAVNQGGEHLSGRKTYGHSMIIDPWGQKISECGLGEAIIYAELDKAYINEIRRKLPALKNRRLIS